MISIKSDFPLLATEINGYPVRYLDTAATSQKPRVVIDALSDFYLTKNANIYRGVHTFAETATALYEDARAVVAQFIGCDSQELIFTSGCTEGINFIATAWATQQLKQGDEIVISELEHHANILPWQRVAQVTGAVIRVIPIHDDGTLNLQSIDTVITDKTRMVSVTLVSNALGTHVDVAPLIARAHLVGARVLLDAAQAVAHISLDVKALGCDFLTFSGHKMLGPTGIGALYIRQDIRHEVEPYQLGGGMVSDVDFHTARYIDSVSRFEAGTPPVAQAIGLAAAVRYINGLDMNVLQAHEAALCRRTIEGLSSVEGVRVLGPIQQLQQRGHLVSFRINGVHPHDAAAFLSSRGVCVRAGTHCAQPLFKRLGLPTGSIRASFYGYTQPEDIEVLLEMVGELASKGPA